MVNVNLLIHKIFFKVSYVQLRKTNSFLFIYSLKKRKADEKPEGGHHIEKKIKPEKCKQLLKVIDVDVFLSHVHGDT